MVPYDKDFADFGASSAIALSTAVVRTINSIHNPLKPIRLHFLAGNTNQDRLAEQQSNNVTKQALVLPTRAAARKYVKSFFDCVHPIFPIIHRPSFQSKYQEVWTGDNDDDGDNDSEREDRTFLATMHMIFALGAKYSNINAQADRATIAEQFYQASRKELPLDLIDSASCEGIQLLLLQAIYLQSTRYASRCWNVVGMAVRAAQSLEFHQNLSKSPGSNQLQREMQRRIWHTCVIFDRQDTTSLSITRCIY